jgi:hypothetical protein
MTDEIRLYPLEPAERTRVLGIALIDYQVDVTAEGLCRATGGQ